MASELRVNTLKDASGNNSVATSVVFNGTSKAWVNVNGTGTPSFNDSYNASSLTDVGTGSRRISYTTNMNNANYAVASACFSDRVSLIGAQSDDTYTSSQTQYRNNDSRNANFVDTDRELFSVHGDLA